MLGKILLLCFIGFAYSSSVSRILLQRHSPDNYEDQDVAFVPAKQIPWEKNQFFRSDDYPCPAEGFFVHRTNSSRFYRCVKFKKAEKFTLYLFECPTGQAFLEGVNTCAREVVEGSGKAPDESQDDGVAGEGDEAAAGDGAGEGDGTAAGDGAGEGDGTAAGDEAAAGDGAGEGDGTAAGDGAGEGDSSVDKPVDPWTVVGGGDQTGGTDESGVGGGEAGNKPDGEAGAGETEGSDGAAVPDVIPPGNLKCFENPAVYYEQHALYCNIFHRCGDASILFPCNEGTAFSAQNQMCRLISMDDYICIGKEIYPNTILRFASPFGIVPEFPLVPNSQPFGLDASSMIGLEDNYRLVTEFKNQLGQPVVKDNLSPELFLQGLYSPYTRSQQNPVIYDVPKPSYQNPYKVHYVSPNYQPYRQSFNPYSNFFGSFYSPIRNRNTNDESLEQYDDFRARKSKSRRISY